MAGIDNSIYCYILKHLSGIDNDTEFRQSVLTKELLVYNDTLRSNLVNGRSGNHLVYWPDDAQSSLWRNGADTSKEVKAEFEKLDKKAGEQKFPNKMETEYSFSSLAYDVLLRHMSKYSSEYKGKELVAVKEAICWCLDSQCLPESFSKDIWSQNSFEEIATFIISSVEKAKAKGVKNRTTQTATAALRKLKKVYYSELSSKENLEKTLAEIDPSVCPSASSENDISASWAGAVKKHCNYFNFLVKEQDNNLVGCSFWLPTDEKYKEHILNGTLFEESLSESFTPFFPRPGDYLFTILSLNILNEEDTEHITLKTKSNLKILLDSLWNTLIDYAKKGIFFKTLYANVPVDTAFWENLGFVKHSEANGVFFLDMTTISDGVCPKELQQLYAEHFEKKGFMKAISLLKQASKNAPKKGIITIAAAVFVFLFVLGAAKIISPPRPPVDEPEEPEITADVETAPEENYTITLTPSRTMSIMDFDSNVETIKKRLDVLCDGEEYSLETDNLMLTVSLPKSVFHDEEPEDIMVAYVAHAGNLYLYDRQNYGIFGGESLSIERKNIENVSCKTGTIEGLDIAKFNIEAEPYIYIELILTPECAAKIAEEISDWNEPIFGHDITNDAWAYFHTFLDLEHRAIYLPGDVSDSHFADLMVHLYREEPLTDSLYIEVNREIEWEATAEATYPGANQCDIKDLQGPTVQVVYTSYKEEKDSGDWVDSEIGFKKRLDLLEQPYAFGTVVNSEGYISAVIRTSPERMGPPIMDLLSCYKSDFLYVSGNKHVECDGYDTVTEIITKDDGSKEYRVETLVSDWYETTNLRDLLPELEEGETCELKLCLDFVPVLSAYVDNSLEEKQVSFTHLSFNDHEALSASNEWVLKLMDAIINDSRVISFTPNSFEFYDEKGEIDDEGTFGIHYAEYLDELNDSMHALSDDMLFSYSSTDPGVLYVYTLLPVDESLPQASIEMAEKIFYASDFENSFLSSISIILINEDNVEKERARIFFNKSSYQEDLTYNTIFTNGRLDKYSAEFESAINSSSFFATLQRYN